MGEELPVVYLGEKAVELALAWMVTCALLVNGKVKCFGWNDNGQLGQERAESNIGSGLKDMRELGFVNLGRSVRAEQLATGGKHVCVIATSGEESKGKVKCWGSNEYGQLGLGDKMDRGFAQASMGDSLPFVDLGVNLSVRKLALGKAHTCVLFTIGRVKCFGMNSNGQLGHGHFDDVGGESGQMGDGLPFIPLGRRGEEGTADLENDNVKEAGENIISDEFVLDISAGFDHTCALLTKGQAKCWGVNSVGQLGLGHTENVGGGKGSMGDALPVVNLDSTEFIVKINAGAHSTCVTLRDERVRCFGWNDRGQLGYNDIIDRGDSMETLKKQYVPFYHGERMGRWRVGFVGLLEVREVRFYYDGYCKELVGSDVGVFVSSGGGESGRALVVR